MKLLLLAVLVLAVLLVGYYSIDTPEKCAARGGTWSFEKAKAWEFACSKGSGFSWRF